MASPVPGILTWKIHKNVKLHCFAHNLKFSVRNTAISIPLKLSNICQVRTPYNKQNYLKLDILHPQLFSILYHAQAIFNPNKIGNIS